MLHSIGCAQPDPSGFLTRWNSPNYTAACVHGFISGIDGTVYQTLPWNFRAPHCGGKANNTHIGVEMCEPAEIHYTYGANFTVNNREAAVACATRTYNAAVELFAMLCKKYNLDPLKDGVIISHNEGRIRGVAGGHVDPEHLWTGLGLSYTMDGFRKDVAKLVNEGKDEPEVKPTPAPVPVPDPAPAPVPVEPKDLKVGDEVKLVSGSKYANGASIPSWVFDKVLYVRYIAKNGDVTISTLKTGDITGVVKPTSLVKNGQENKNEETVPAEEEKETFTPYLITSAVAALNCRKEPSINSPVTYIIRDRLQYTIVEEKNGWGRLKSGIGWVKLEYTTTTQDSAPELKYRVYTIKNGDTLWKIAAKELGNGERYSEIKKLNNLKSDTIYANQVLKLPLK